MLKSMLVLFGSLTSKQKRNFILLQLFLALVSVVELLSIASIAPLMAVVTDREVIRTNVHLRSLFEFFAFSSDLSFIRFLAVITLLIVVVSNVLILCSNWLLHRYGLNVGRLIAVNLFFNYLNKNYLFHTKNNSSLLARNIFQEVIRVTNNVLVQSLLMSAKAFTVSFIVVSLFLMHPYLTLVAALVLGGSYLTMYFVVQKPLRRNGWEITHLIGESYKTVSEGFGGIRDVKLHGSEMSYAQILNRLMKQYSSKSTYNSVVPLIPRYMLEVVTLAGVVIACLYMADSEKGVVEYLPILSVFALATLKLMPALQQVFVSASTINGSLSSLETISKDLSTVGDMDAEPAARARQSFNSTLFSSFTELVLTNVSFKYPESRNYVLHDLNFKIEKKKVVAFVGPSGGGKSTLVDLISGLLEPTEGSVKIGNVVLSDSNRPDWQSQIGYVSQSVYLVDASFRENIAFGQTGSEVDLSRVEAAAKRAQLHEFIMNTPAGYDTVVGERGVQLSGGQRQRIGIARALYRNPSLLIFDEATSALDNITEAEIMKSIEALSGEKTIILIAHRLTTVKNADVIYLVNDGRVEGTGTYEQLLASNELFKDMVQR